jgi:hemolysin D
MSETAVSTKPQAPAAEKPATPTPADLEFLPAALEILETPPAPRSVAFMLTICAFVALALIWSFFGRLDVHAVAWGKIEAAGRSKVIQPFDPGKILKIHVETGARVKAGEALAALDPAEAKADEQAFSDSLAASRAEIARRRAAIDAVRAVQRNMFAPEGKVADALPASASIAFDADAPAAARARENAVLSADLAQLGDTLRNIDKQMAQKNAMRQRLNMSMAFQTDLIKTLEERVGVREASIKLSVGTKINLFDAQESLQKSQAQLASDRGQLIETDAALDELQSQKIKIASQFVADNETKLADADRKAADLSQQLAKAQAKLARTILTSPIDGVVQQVAVTTIGQVVTTGQQLMVVTPASGALQVDAFVSNIDIGFVKLGQDAEVKVDAFPFTRFGVLRARVVRIATEAIDEQEAKRQQSNAIAPTSAAGASGAPQGQMQNFVFPVTLALGAQAMKIDGAVIPLSPGMTVSAEIKTDSRRVIDYLLSPISRVTSEAMKER